MRVVFGEVGESHPLRIKRETAIINSNNLYSLLLNVLKNNHN